jgi:redox-sensing transcriptional repressor
VVAGVDRDGALVGREMGGWRVRHVDDLPAVVTESGAEIGVLAVPAEAAQANYEQLVAAGVKGVLNFAPARVKPVAEVPLKNVDLRINLEEVAFLLRAREVGEGE